MTGPAARCAAVVAAAALALAWLGVGRGAVAQPVGDPARGRAVFEEKGCVRCHLPREQGQGMGPPLEVVRHPQGMLELAGRLWNHAPGMFALLEKQGLKWPEVTQSEMGDLMAYLQAVPARDPTPDPIRGQIVLVGKGCLKCHRLRGEGGTVATELTADQTRYQSPTIWATIIWNHAPRMAGHAARLGVLYPRFSGDEMANLVEFLKRSAVTPR